MTPSWSGNFSFGSSKIVMGWFKFCILCWINCDTLFLRSWSISLRLVHLCFAEIFLAFPYYPFEVCGDYSDIICFITVIDNSCFPFCQSCLRFDNNIDLFIELVFFLPLTFLFSYFKLIFLISFLLLALSCSFLGSWQELRLLI